MLAWLFFAFRNIFRNRRRSFMAIAMISVAVSAILISGGFVAYSFSGLAEMTIRSNSGSMQIANRKTFEFEPLSNDTKLDDETLSYLDKELGSSDKVQSFYDKTILEGLASTGSLSRAVIISATDIVKEVEMASIFSPITRGFVPNDIDENPFQSMIGDELAKSLSINIGDSLTLLTSTLDGGVNAVDVTVTAFVKTGIPDIDTRTVIIPMQVASILLTEKAVQKRIVVLKDIENTSNYKISIPNPNIEARSWEEISSYYQQVKSMYTFIFAFFFVMIGSITFISLINIMSMVVLERVREIGTLRAFGFSRIRIQFIFMLEAFLMGVIGFLIGLLFATVVGYVINVSGFNMPAPPGMTKGYPLAINITLSLALLCFVIVFFVTILSSFFSSRLAVKLPVVEALGHV